MTTTKERKVFRKATPQIVEGHLVNVVETPRGHLILMFDTGEQTTLPAGWTIPCDLYEGQHLRAGWEHNRFMLEELEDDSEQ